jgi:hypothetical protein
MLNPLRDMILKIFCLYEGVVILNKDIYNGNICISVQILNINSMVRLLYFCSKENININFYDIGVPMSDDSTEDVLRMIVWDFIFMEENDSVGLPDDLKRFCMELARDLEERKIFNKLESEQFRSVFPTKPQQKSDKISLKHSRKLVNVSRFDKISKLLHIYEGVTIINWCVLNEKLSLVLQILKPISIVRLLHLSAQVNVRFNVDVRSLPMDNDSVDDALGRLVWTFVFSEIKENSDLPEYLKWLGVYMLQDLRKRKILMTPEFEKLRLLWIEELLFKNDNLNGGK